MILIAMKCALLLGLALISSFVLRPASASTRRMVLAAAIVGVLALPPLMLMLPTWGILGSGTENDVVEVAEDVLSPLTSVAGVGIAGPADAREELRSLVFGQSTPRSAVTGRPLRLVSMLVPLCIWMAMVLLGRLLLGVLWTWWIRWRSTTLRDGKWVETFKEVATEVGVSTTFIRLCSSPKVKVPTVLGVFFPAICLPPEATTWTRDQRRMVLLHELAHIRRSDNLFRLLGQVMCALHWFDPLAWWIVSRLEAESEHAADDEVLKAGIDGPTYAARLVRFVREHRTGLAGASAMAESSWLEARIASILDGRRRRDGLGLGGRLMFLSFGSAILVALSCATSAEQPPVERASTPSGRDETPVARAVADYLDVPTEGVEITIEESLQDIAEDEVRILVDRHGPRSVTLIAIDPHTGRVLALSTHGSEGVAEAVRAREPGSTMKPITIAAALEEGMSPEARFFCENGRWVVGGETFRDYRPMGWLDVGGIVARSSNIGAGKIYREELGWEGLRSWHERFRFGTRPGVQLPGVQSGTVLEGEGSILRGVMAANGIGLRVSPMQLVAAYSALANGGVYHQPTLVQRMIDPNGRVIWEHQPEGRRILSEQTALAVIDMLEAVVSTDLGTGRNARVEGMTIAGKTGTVRLDSQDGEEEHDASFVGIARSDAPRMVVYVGIEGARGANVTGGRVAAPAFARFISRALHAGDFTW